MMAMSYAGKVRVNAIAPGVTLISGDQSQENFEKSWRKSLSGVGATPQEIAATVLYNVEHQINQRRNNCARRWPTDTWR